MARFSLSFNDGAANLFVFHYSPLLRAVARILTAIFEPDFLRCSYRYRPNVGAREAVNKLTVKLQFGEYHHVVEVDIENYFGTIDHAGLVNRREQRVDDRQSVRLIRKWLKAGGLETDGAVVHPTTSTPQGGVVSSVLANIDLHYGAAETVALLVGERPAPAIGQSAG